MNGSAVEMLDLFFFPLKVHSQQVTATIFKKGTSNYCQQVLSAGIRKRTYSSECCLTEDDGIGANHGAPDKGPSCLAQARYLRSVSL